MNWYGSKGNASIDPKICSARIANMNQNMDEYSPCMWEDAQNLGLVSTRTEYIDALRKVCIHMAECGISAYAKEKDVELLQMVRMLDEMDIVINLMTESLVEWYIFMTPTFSRKYQRASGSKMVLLIRKHGSESMKKIAKEILSLTETRTNLMKEVSKKAFAIIPNMSSLVGGLVAARIISRAGGLSDTARMPGSSIQVLGAETALFSHIRTGSPSPKHGLLYQHHRIHNAPKEIRGHVSRLLATKLAIAARIDFYSGDINKDFIDQANEKVDALFEVTND